MIENMLFLARADDARMALHLELTDAALELNRIAEYFAGIAADASVTISVQGEAIVIADPILLRRAVSNLVANAIRHTAPGGDVTLSVKERAEEIIVTVSNPGPAIPRELGICQ